MEIKIFSLEPDGECPEPYNNSNGTYEYRYRYRYFPGEPSVLDPNTSNLVPDPEFWPNLDLDPETYVYMCGSWSVFGIRIQIRIHNTGYDYLVLVCLPQAMVSAFTALAQPCRDLLLVRVLNWGPGGMAIKKNLLPVKVLWRLHRSYKPSTFVGGKKYRFLPSPSLSLT